LTERCRTPSGDNLQFIKLIGVYERDSRAPVLKKSRWLLLKRSENLGDEQHFRLRDLLRYNLKTRLPSQGSFPAALGLQLACLGRQVPGRMVPADPALPHRAHEEDRPFPAPAPGTDPQLFQGAKINL
jgi:hypothetical protein